MSLIHRLNDLREQASSSIAEVNEGITNATGQFDSVLNNINTVFNNIDRFTDDDKRSMGVQNLYANIKNFARNNRFRIVIPTPPSLTGTRYDSRSMQALMVQCQAVSLPARTVATWNHRNIGPIEKMPYDVIFQEVTMTFRVDSKYDTRRFFQEWMQSMTTSDNLYFRYRNEYTSNIKIMPLDLIGKPIAQIGLYNAYPTNLSVINYDENSTDAITEFSITFAYTEWFEETIGTSEIITSNAFGQAVDSFFDTNFAATSAQILGVIS